MVQQEVYVAASLICHSIGGPRLVVTRGGDFARAYPPIQVDAVIKAPVSRIFNAWTIPEYVEAWYPHDSSVTARCDIDLKSGGHYRIEVNADEGPELIWGVFRRVQPPCKLIYSLRSHRLSTSTLVVVSFLETGDTTRLCLRQDGFCGAQESAYFASEWTSRFERLSHLLG